MRKKLQQAVKPLLKSLFLLSLVLGLTFGLTFGNTSSALAARSGGRIGGGSFRVPSSRTYTPRTYTPGGGGYSPYPGGGFGFPFLIPFWGIGGGFGSLFSILIFFAVANFLLQSFRRASDGGQTEEYSYNSNPSVAITKLQVGMLANARTLQAELNRIAQEADTDTGTGRAVVVQETSLALLRHPEYWVYAGGGTQQARLSSAEGEFNRLALAERSKFTEETLSNVNNSLKSSTPKDALNSSGELDNPTRLITEGPGEYIVVTLLVATLGNFQIPSINSTEDLNTALRILGSLSSDKLLAIEVLWTPQESGDTLSSDDMLMQYADLKLV